MNKPVPPPARDDVEIVTLGCRLNAFESDGMRALAENAALSNAVIVNTCAVTGEAVRQARQAIRRARRERPDAEIIVTGCAAQIDPQSFADMAEVSRVVGNAEKMHAATFAPTEQRVVVADIMQTREIAPHIADAHSDRTRAYLQVQNGCDHRCTFCVIPYGRGNSRSAPAGDVITNIQRLVDEGAPEIVLTGVDLTSWGADLPGAPSLGNLVARILKHAPSLKMLRLSSIDAIEMDPLLFDLVTSNERIAPYLHLSLQHGDDLILKRMKRRHSRAQAIALCAALKQRRPDIALGADLIAGFPTEDETHFANTLSLIDACDLAFVHAFPYSPRPMTPAARMPQLARPVIKERAARLRDAGASALTRHLDKWVGREATALIETETLGRLPDFTPIRLPFSLAEKRSGDEGRSENSAHVEANAEAMSPSQPILPAPHSLPPLRKGEGVRLRFTHHDGAHLYGTPV